MLQRMGQLFALRHLVNLSSDLLDVPDFYWEHENLEQLYRKTSEYLSVSKRTSVSLLCCIVLLSYTKLNIKCWKRMFRMLSGFINEEILRGETKEQWEVEFITYIVHTVIVTDSFCFLFHVFSCLSLFSLNELTQMYTTECWESNPGLLVEIRATYQLSHR